MTTIPTLLCTGGHIDGSFDAVHPYYSNVGLGRCPFLGASFRTESQVSQIIRAPGTISYLSWGLSSVLGASLTLALNRMSSSTALAVSFGTTTTGWVTDSTHSVGVSSGDTLDFVASLGSAISYSGSFYCISARFDATTDSAQMLAAVAYQGNSLVPTTKFVNFLGVAGNGLAAGGTSVLTESETQFQCLAAGIWQNMACHLESNTFTQITTVTNRVSGSNGHMAISIPASTSGYFEDNSSSDKDTVSVGDYLNYRFVGSVTGSGNLGLDWIGAHFLATDATLCMIGGASLFPEPAFSDYTSLFGGGDIDTPTVRATGLFPYAMKASNFINYLTAQTNQGNATFTLLRNGSASTLAVSSGAGNTGYFIDNTSTDAVNFAVGDTCANEIVKTSDVNTSVTWASAALLLKASA